MIFWTELNLFWTLANAGALYWVYRRVIRDPEGAKALAVRWQRYEMEKLRKAFETAGPPVRQFLDGLARAAGVLMEGGEPPAAAPPAGNGEELKTVGQGRRRP